MSCACWHCCRVQCVPPMSVALEAGQPPVPPGKGSRVSVMAAPPSSPSLPCLAFTRGFCFTLPPASFVLRAATELRGHGAVPRGREARWWQGRGPRGQPGGRGGRGQRGGPGAQPQPVPGPRRASEPRPRQGEPSACPRASAPGELISRFICKTAPQ